MLIARFFDFWNCNKQSIHYYMSWACSKRLCCVWIHLDAWIIVLFSGFQIYCSFFSFFNNCCFMEFYICRINTNCFQYLEVLNKVFFFFLGKPIARLLCLSILLDLNLLFVWIHSYQAVIKSTICWYFYIVVNFRLVTCVLLSKNGLLEGLHWLH